MCLSVLMSLLGVGGANGQPCVTTTNVQPSVGNVPGYAVNAVCDTVGSRVLAIEQAPAAGDGVLVHAYNGVQWTTLPRLGAVPPGNRRYSGIWTFDTARGEALLFGGSINVFTGNETNTLFALRNGVWEQRTWTGPTPPALGGAVGAYDSRRGRTIYLCPGPAVRYYQTWEWTGTGWEQGPDLGPVSPEGFVFDAARNLGFLMSSEFQGSIAFDDMWEYTPPAPGAPASQGSWQRVPPPASGLTQAYTSTNLTYDPFRGRIIRCFGRPIGNTYAYTEGVWVWDPVLRKWDYTSTLELSLPSAARRGKCGVTYDTNRDLLVIAGGARQDVPSAESGGFTAFFDTWEQQVRKPGLASSSFGPVSRCLSDGFTLAVAPVGDAGTIQWTRNGTPVGSGALLSIPALSLADAGEYRATVSNSCGTYISPPSTLRVDPPITSFASPTFWPGCSTCPGTTLTIIPPTFAPQPGINQRIHLQKLVGSTWTDVQVVSPGGLFQYGPLQASDSGDYRVLVDGSACPGVVESIKRIDVGISILSGPANQNIAACTTATFSMQARGTCIQSYQWFKNDTEPVVNSDRVSGANTPTLTIARCGFEDEGTYRCRVIDVCETAYTPAATLSLALSAPVWVERPMNAQPPYLSTIEYWVGAYDENRGVVVLYGGYTQTGQNSNSMWEYDGVTWTVRQSGFPFVNTTSGQFLYDGAFPPNTRASAMVYNPDDRKVYLIGPYAWNRPMAIYTWDGTRWERPYYGPVNGDTARTHAVYDRVNRRIVIVRSTGGSNNSELLIYDPATNQLTGPTPMQPQVQLGVEDSALWYDEKRAAVIWYNNINIFQLPTMWRLTGMSTWVQLSDTPPRLPYATPVRYDPVRSQAIGMGGSFDGAYNFTGTMAWPGLNNSSQVALASDWVQVLPDGPPRNPSGAAFSPPNFFGPRQWGGLVFDRKRRAMVAAGVTFQSGQPTESWRTYERRYLDRVVFDKLTAPETVSPTQVRLEAYAAGIGTLNYQWRRNGAAISNGPGPAGTTYSGANSRVLTISGVTSAFDGSFTCAVTNACGTAITNVALIGCPADANRDGSIDVGDIFAFLSLWFSNDPRADIDQNSVVEVADIFAYLTRWFSGC